MSEDEFHKSGFDAFSDLLEEYTKKADPESVMDVLEIGAKDFTEDVRKLPKPLSKIRAPGYVHLIDTVTYRREKDEVATGWGKYYGPMVDKGTVKMEGVAHMTPTFERNKEKYYKKMQDALFG